MEDYTVRQLTEKLGYRSKTSLSRILHGKSSYQSCALFCLKMRPLLSGEWQNRFQDALFSEKIGLKRHSLLKGIDDCLFRRNQEALPPAGPLPVPFPGGTVVILGCPWARTFSMLDRWLASSEELRVLHYIVRDDLLNARGMIPGLISHVTCMRYSAVMLNIADLINVLCSWNMILWTWEDQAWLMIIRGEQEFWSPLPDGAAQAREMLHFLEDLPKEYLYRYDQLQTGSDYMAFTEASYRMEHNRKALIIKPCPGLQMLPPEILKRTFLDYLSGNLEPVSAAKESLILTQEKRSDNFFHQRQSIRMIMSLASLSRFARSGRMDDQFFACLPFTREERVEIINTLQAFSEKDTVRMSFRQEDWPVSLEAYDGFGVLFYPTFSVYNTRLGDYRELFLPGRDFTDLFFQYAAEFLRPDSPEFCSLAPADIFSNLKVSARWAAEL